MVPAAPHLGLVSASSRTGPGYQFWAEQSSLRPHSHKNLPLLDMVLSRGGDSQSVLAPGMRGLSSGMDQRQGKAPSAAPAITKIPVPVSPARPGRVRQGRGVSERVSRVSYYSTKQNHLLSAVPGAFPARSRLPRHTIICGCSLPPVCGQQPKPEHEGSLSGLSERGT